MRPDMGKIVIDAHRHGGWGGSTFSHKVQKHRAREDERPTKESMSRSRHGTKSLGDKLNPLYRWLDKQVGRRWDDVYSDVKDALKGGYTNIEHVKDHLMSRVTLRVEMIDGWPHEIAPEYVGRRHSISRALRRGDIYVDGKGFLRKLTTKRPSPAEKERRSRQQAAEIVMLDQRTAAAKIDGVWYRAPLEDIPYSERRVVERDSLQVLRNPMTSTVLRTRTVRVRRPVEDVLLQRISVAVGLQYDRWVDMHSNSGRCPYDQMLLYAPRIFTMSKREIKQRIPEDKR